MKILQKLCSLNGLSGDESEVRAYILNQISPYCSGRVDPAGNILAFKKGRKQPKRKLLFEAHMDETGYVVTRIDSSGLLYLDSVGVSASVSVGGFCSGYRRRQPDVARCYRSGSAAFAGKRGSRSDPQNGDVVCGYRR